MCVLSVTGNSPNLLTGLYYLVFGVISSCIGSRQLWSILSFQHIAKFWIKKYVKVKTDKSKIWPIMTVKCVDEVLKCDKCEVRLPR